MNELKVNNYNFEDTLMGGQSFTWHKKGDTYFGVTTNRAIKLTYSNGKLTWQTYPEANDEKFLKTYLRLDVDYEDILSRIQIDEHMIKAVDAFPSLRLLKQDFEVTLLTFLISANNSIKSIRRSVGLLCEKFGEKIKVDDEEISLFPTVEKIAGLSIEELRSCSLGFRAKYVKNAAEYLIETQLAERIRNMNEAEARQELMQITGVGPKIADCILVFSLSHDSITPMDVWGKRILVDFYGQSEKMKYDEMRDWIKDYFKGDGAWAGQFLFEYIRTQRKVG